jgi:PPM family protein phosphatase
MGTTLTAIYVGEEEVAIAHVGDSRAYCLRDGELVKLTEDHSLVDELMRQGRLTPQEAVEHPQRSVITRALGPEGSVEVDTHTFRARADDVYLLCSDGLTTMLSEEEMRALLLEHHNLREAGEALIAAANRAGGRDNITVLLLRLEEVEVGAPAAGGEARMSPGAGQGASDATMVGAAAVTAPVAQKRPRRPSPNGKPGPGTRRRAGLARARRTGVAAAVLVVLGLLAGGAYLALQSVYFIATNDRGLVTIYRGVPFSLPGGIALYSSDYVSGVSASALAAAHRRALLDHSLRSEANAAALVRSLELGQLE